MKITVVGKKADNTPEDVVMKENEKEKAEEEMALLSLLIGFFTGFSEDLDGYFLAIEDRVSVKLSRLVIHLRKLVFASLLSQSDSFRVYLCEADLWELCTNRLDHPFLHYTRFYGCLHWDFHQLLEAEKVIVRHCSNAVLWVRSLKEG